MDLTAFLAIEIQPSPLMLGIRKSIAKLMEKERFKLYPTENCRMIIRHLGTFDPEFLPDLNRIIGAVVNSTEPFDLELEGVFVYPYVQKPDVLWWNFKQTEILMEMAKKLDEELVNYGVHQEFFAFYPHITFARMRRVKNKHNVEKIAQQYGQLKASVKFPVTQIVMLEEFTKNNQKQYRLRNKFILGQNL